MKMASVRIIYNYLCDSYEKYIKALRNQNLINDIIKIIGSFIKTVLIRNKRMYSS